MLKKVQVIVSDMKKEEKEKLAKKLEREGLAVEEIMEEAKGMETLTGEEILITDCRAGVLWAKERGCPCLGIEKKERLSCPYITTDWRFLTASFLERIYDRFYANPWIILETKRCVVREMTTEDLDGLYELYADKANVRYLEPLSEDRQEERSRILSHIERMYHFFEYGMWLVETKKDRQLIGRAGLLHREINGKLEPELGYLIRRENQRQGYGLEVCQGILQYVREELSMTFVNCFVAEENEASIGLVERLGFQKVEKDGEKSLSRSKEKRISMYRRRL